jgi:hypothetical protein
MSENQNLPVIPNDFDDTGTEDRVIKGVLLRCIDGVWTTKNETPLPTSLMAIGCADFLQLWKEQKPVETIREKPLPRLDDLNGTIPVGEWELGKHDGKPKPPWQHQYAVYLVDRNDGSTYTSCNSTAGQAIAYRELKDRINMMRKLRGANVLPIVTLDKATFAGKFGPKIRPDFKVLSWIDPSGNAASLPATSAPQIEHKPQTVREIAENSAFAPKTMPGKPVKFGESVKPPSVSEELDDELPGDLAPKKKTA